MSNFVLVPVDGGDPVQVPPGETVLGRGPLLGVSDKRVSRHHGLLENLNGQLRLKPAHVNPCFVQSSLNDAPRPLDKDRWFPLHHGDLFSLLPGQYLYRVEAAGTEDVTPRNSQMFEEVKEPPPSPQKDTEAPPPVGEDQGQTPPPDLPKESTVEEEARSPHRTGDKRDSAPSKEAERRQTTRKRVLPAWMMTVAAAPSTSSGRKAAEKAVGPAGPSTSKKAGPAKQATPTTTSSTEEAELKEKETTPKKKRQKSNRVPAAPSKSDDSVDEAAMRSACESSRAAISDDSDGVAMETEGETNRGEMFTEDRNAPTRTSGVGDSENQTNGRVGAVGSRSEPAQLKARLRTPCPYGKQCYRKNPLHFQECSHPGDTDYEEEEEEEQEADRPECPYGTDCYRKNPLHRKEYKHTKRPARSTRTAASKTAADSEDEDFSDHDSFINDETEDEGDDSDYAPPVSDDSEKEDIRRLQKEAKAFMRHRTKTDE